MDPYGVHCRGSYSSYVSEDEDKIIFSSDDDNQVDEYVDLSISDGEDNDEYIPDELESPNDSGYGYSESNGYNEESSCGGYSGEEDDFQVVEKVYHGEVSDVPVSFLDSLENRSEFDSFVDYFQFVQQKNMAVSIERPSSKLSRSLRFSGHHATAEKMERYVQAYLGKGKNFMSSRESIVTEGRDWNSEFQTLIELPDSRIKFLGLRNLAHDFVYAAETYGKIIISEHCLPLIMKTIKPIDIGGVAGGLKFICQGILFKFAIDYSGIYGGDENAMKAASHELKGLTNYFHCGIKDLHVPLMAFIDYRGFRLMALSILPIGSKTLCYGSADAGRTVYDNNMRMNDIAKEIGKTLNLKKHAVGPMQTDIHGPGDIEGHEGKDGKLYMLDFARVAPPQPPKKRGQQLFNLFRMEFVINNNIPLSSDAFSGLGSHNGKVHNDEIRFAFKRYTNEDTFYNHCKTVSSV